MDKLKAFANCKSHLAAADSNPLPDGSADFGHALVLHHVPDTKKVINDCVRKLKPGAPPCCTSTMRLIIGLSGFALFGDCRTPSVVSFAGCPFRSG